MEVQFMENKISGRGVTDADKNRVQLDAERESVTRLKHQLELKNEEANKLYVKIDSPSHHKRNS